MHTYVKQFVSKCSVCQYNKYSTHSPYGLLQPLPVPNQVWEDISIDFITHLPCLGHKTVIWVIVDRLTKFSHFIALPTNFSAHFLASVSFQRSTVCMGSPKLLLVTVTRYFLTNFGKSFFWLWEQH